MLLLVSLVFLCPTLDEADAGSIPYVPHFEDSP